MIIRNYLIGGSVEKNIREFIKKQLFLLYKRNYFNLRIIYFLYIKLPFLFIT